MRLLWSESAAPPPDIVVAKDLSSVYEEHHEYLAACSGPPSARLIDVEDGVVSRFIWVGGGTRMQDGPSEPPDRTLDVGSTQVEIFEPYGHADLPADLPIWPGYVSASWTRDGQSWLLYGGPVTDAELTELVELLEHAPEPGEPLEIDDWSVLAGAEFVIHWSGVDDESRLSYDVEAENLLLHVIDAPGTVWPSSVFAGDRVVDVAGKPAILHEQPDRGRSCIGNQPMMSMSLRGRQRRRPATGDRPDDRARARRRRAPPASLVHANAIDATKRRTDVRRRAKTTVTPWRLGRAPTVGR